jgi:hypothetical protein
MQLFDRFPSRARFDPPSRGQRTWRLLLAALIALLVALVSGIPVGASRRGSDDVAAAGSATTETSDDADMQRRPPPGDEPPDTTEPPTTEPPTTDTTETEPDPPPPPTNRECDAPGGFARPTGTVPPGYVYSPTAFTGAVHDPQPDDTFVADAAGHAPYVGKLRTRVANGREEFLVCAHVGTNFVDSALTPFPLTGPGAHPATIAPRVVVIDAIGTRTTYDVGAPGISSTLSHYAGATDPHTGYMQMWVPFTANLHEPGFIVRVEIRGTASLPGGGTGQVMGADEVYVHVGPSPAHRSTRIVQAVGVALDDGAIAERPEDPGVDDISTLLAPHIEPFVARRIEEEAPIDLPDDWEWGPEFTTTGQSRGGTISSIDAFVHSLALDVENFNETEGRAVVTFQGTIRPEMTVYPKSVGLVTIVGGSCDVDSPVTFGARGSFTIDLSDDLTRPEIDVGFIDADYSVDFVDAHGTLAALYGGVIPGTLNCNAIEDKISNGIVEAVDEELQAARNDPALLDAIAREANKAQLGDITDGPLSNADITLPNGVGFILNSPRYVPTAPAGHLGGDILITDRGANLAGGVLVYDQGGQRFEYSYIPSEQRSVVASTSDRTRPSGSGTFDVGMVISGATVNQLLRALTAGRPVPLIEPPGDVFQQFVSPSQTALDVGLLDLVIRDIDADEGPGTNLVDAAVHPSVSPQYLPTPPAGWPVPDNVDMAIPSMRVAISSSEGAIHLVTMATDVRVGLDATIDPATNHLVPVVPESKVDVAARFLRLGPSINQLPDPEGNPSSPLATAVDRIEEAVPGRLAEGLAPVELPDLSGDIEIDHTTVHLGPVHVENLSLGTVGGGHLGVYVDVLPGGPPPKVVTNWTSAADGSPVSFTTDLRLPATSGYRLQWTVTDVNSGGVVYRSPAAGESALSKTFPASALSVYNDPCTGEHSIFVDVSIDATRGGVTRTETGRSGFIWPGPPPTDPPSWCTDPDPDPDPEPDPDPPICRRQPWKCPDG